MILTRQHLYAADTTKHASAPLVWNGAEISSQYFSQVLEVVWWLCLAVLMNDSADPEGALRAFLAVSTNLLLKADMQDVEGSSNIPIAEQIYSISWSRWRTINQKQGWHI